MKICISGLKTDLIILFIILFARVPQTFDGNYKIFTRGYISFSTVTLFLQFITLP